MAEGIVRLFNQGGGALSTTAQFDNLTSADAVFASVHVTDLASIDTLVVSSNATFQGLITASNINAAIGSFTSLFVNGSAVLTSSVGATAFDGITVTSIATINHLAVSSQASFTGSIQASNTSVVNLIVAGSHSVAGVSQFSIASFTGTIFTSNIQGQGTNTIEGFDTLSIGRIIVASNINVSGNATFIGAITASNINFVGGTFSGRIVGSVIDLQAACVVTLVGSTASFLGGVTVVGNLVVVNKASVAVLTVSGSISASNVVANNGTFSDLTVTNRHRWKLANTASQTIASTGNTVLNWNQNFEVVGVSHATVTTSSIVTISQAGNYLIGFEIAAISNSAGITAIDSLKNGSIISRCVLPSVSTFFSAISAKMESFNVNDIVSIRGIKITNGLPVSVDPNSAITAFWGVRL